jgi:hypothetical protein
MKGQQSLLNGLNQIQCWRALMFAVFNSTSFFFVSPSPSTKKNERKLALLSSLFFLSFQQKGIKLEQKE